MGYPQNAFLGKDVATYADDREEDSLLIKHGWFCIKLVFEPLTAQVKEVIIWEGDSQKP